MQQRGSVIISIISYLRKNISNKASVKLINKTKKKQVKREITFSRCDALLVAINLEGFELYLGRLFPADWLSNGS